GVVQRLGDREVDGRLDRHGRPSGELDVGQRQDRAVQGERLDRLAEPPVGENGRVDATDQVAKLGQGKCGGTPAVGDQGGGLDRACCDELLGGAQVDAE